MLQTYQMYRISNPSFIRFSILATVVIALTIFAQT